MTTDKKRPEVDRERKGPALVSRIPQKSDQSLVTLDNPDDGELFDTGDASDFAGESDRKEPSKSQTPRRARGPAR